MVLLAAPSASAQTPAAPTGSDDFTQSPEAGLPKDPDDRLAELNRRIEGADAKANDLFTQIEQSDRRRQELDAVVADLDRQLSALNAELAVARRDLDRATSAFVAAEREAEVAERKVGEAREQVRRRAAEVYKQGPGGFANFVLGSRDLEDAENRASYVRRVVQTDRALVEALEAAEKSYEERTARLDGLKFDELERTRRIAAVQDGIAGALSRQRATRDALAEETTRKKTLLAKVQSDRAAWQALVARQQMDSTGVAEALARLQSGQTPAPGVVAGLLSFPLPGGQIGSGFGWRVHPIYGTSRFHAGLDISAPEGTPIQAPADGVVVSAGPFGGYGNTVILDHGQSIATLHAHQVGFAVETGQRVTRGQVIGFVGSTGLSTGPHLHLEVRLSGNPTDPVPWLRVP